ncbi:UNVERIFIED_CONTAM: hypothetical protein Slati_1234000 [Sesamum latifolium]|uniref:Uncharacterized protein n=1 Tax=Sesamum latifolium TaxID=2727402 RepID=A0AAW2XFC6_9LAMI
MEFLALTNRVIDNGDIESMATFTDLKERWSAKFGLKSNSDSAFILPKGIIREIEKRMRTLLWKGNYDTGCAKVAWNQVCLPLDEGGSGVCNVQALNYALMSKHMWAVISNRDYSIWVQWVRQYHIRHKTMWTVNANAGSWCWRKLLRLRAVLQPQVEYRIGDGVTLSLWQDP